MPPRTEFKPGEFCWIDLCSHDMEAATTWYSNLFGWKPAAQETHGGPPYAFFTMGDGTAAAVGQMSDEMKAAGVPTMWNSYINTPDCAASEKRAAELGATVTVPTMEIPGHGKLCYILDPEGSSVALWENVGDCTPLCSEDPGSLSWNELMCRDTGKAREFYGALCGWEFADMPMGDVNYTMIKVEGKDAGGMMGMDGPQFEGVPSHWMVYFAVADCDAATAMVQETGGQVRIPPMDIPVGRFSCVSDPQGGTFSLIALSKTDC